MSADGMCYCIRVSSRRYSTLSKEEKGNVPDFLKRGSDAPALGCEIINFSAMLFLSKRNHFTREKQLFGAKSYGYEQTSRKLILAQEAEDDVS